MRLHPDSGIHYRVSIPTAAAFTDVRIAYERAASSRLWMSVIHQNEFSQAGNSAEWNDPNVCFVLWHDADGICAKNARRAKVVEIYSEAIGDDEYMLGAHKDHRSRFLSRVDKLDAVFVHTPRMEKYMQSIGVKKTAVLPAGWDPATAHDRANYQNRKHAYGYWGSEVSPRVESLAAIKEHMQDKIDNFTGMFGSNLLASLSGVAASLYIPHSHVWTLSTWRVWQSVAAGTPMVIPRCVDGESMDRWPMEPEQCVEMPWSYGDPAWTSASAGKDLVEVLNGKRLSAARENLLDSLSKFTTDRMVDDYLVPACAAVSKP